MNDLINLLQTITLLVGLLLSVVVLYLIVYTLGKFAKVFKTLLTALEQIGQPVVCVPQTTTVTAAPEIKEEIIVDAAQAPEAKRYPCHRCKCKLPETPTHSVIKDGITLLVFKCRRCSKETEVDPEKTEPVQPK